MGSLIFQFEHSGSLALPPTEGNGEQDKKRDIFHSDSAKPLQEGGVGREIV